MKKIKLILLIVIFSILGSILKVQAVTNEEFKNMGDGKCVYYLTGGCEYGGWYSSDTSKCNWEPCCKFKMTGYTDYDYTFKKNCNGGKTQYGEESEEKNKSKCLGTGLSCCCLTRPPSTSATPASTFTPVKLISPNIQVPIPGLTLTPADSIQQTENPNGSFSLNIPWISEYIIGIYNYGVSVAGILAAIILMAGGVLWLISAGDASKITQAKELITGSVIGLIILMASYLLLYTVNPELTKFPPITIGAIQRMEFPEGDIATDSVSAIRKSTTRIVIHTAAGLGNRNEVDAFHKSKGWKGIGYNVYIERGGVSVMGRGEDTVGAHSLKYNSTSIGISYAGCAEKTQMNNKTIEQALKNNTITQTQLNTLIEKIKYYQKKYNIPRNMVIGHYEEPVSKACPCLPMDELRKLINP